MSKTIKIGLSTKSIQKAVHDIETYRVHLPFKCRLFIDRLANEVGIPIVNTNIASSRGDSNKSSNVYFVWTETPIGAYGKLVAENEDILFIEFGAGIHYNNGNAHPQASEFGYGVGTYPGQKNAINPGYWWYKDDDGGAPHLSFGTEATMPMYKAYIEMVTRVVDIAKEVFKDG